MPAQLFKRPGRESRASRIRSKTMLVGLPVPTDYKPQSRRTPNWADLSYNPVAVIIDGCNVKDRVLPMVALARDAGFETVFVPGADVREVALVEGVQTVAVDSLAVVESVGVAHLAEALQYRPRS